MERKDGYDRGAGGEEMRGDGVDGDALVGTDGRIDMRGARGRGK